MFQVSSALLVQEVEMLLRIPCVIICSSSYCCCYLLLSRCFFGGRMDFLLALILFCLSTASLL